MEMVRQYSKIDKRYSVYTYSYRLTEFTYVDDEPKPQNLTKRYLRIQARQFGSKYALAA